MNDSFFKNTEILTKTKDIFNQKKNEFLEYMVQDEVYFADLEKIEDYYLRGTVGSYKNVNDNLREIKHKKEILAKLNLQIESVIYQ